MSNLAGVDLVLSPPRIKESGIEIPHNVRTAVPGDLGPLAKDSPAGSALAQDWTLALATAFSKDVTVTGFIELDRSLVEAVILPAHMGAMRRISMVQAKPWPARYVLGNGAAGPDAGTRLALPAAGLVLKNGQTLGVAMDPYCGAAFRLGGDTERLRLEIATRYPGSGAPFREEKRTLVVSANARPDEALFGAFYGTIPDIKPAPAWVHGVRLACYDYLSDGGRGWFDDIDELSKRLPNSEDRSRVVLCLHGWYDYIGKYAFDDGKDGLLERWTAFPSTKKIPMDIAGIHRRLTYARERGFHVVLYYADGMLADDKSPGFDPKQVYVDSNGEENFPSWRGPDTVGTNRYLDPSHPAVRDRYLARLRALIREFGGETDGFVFDETFYIRPEWISVTRAGQPECADRAMMTFVADLTRATQEQSGGKLVFLTSDSQGFSNYAPPAADFPPTALVAHGTYQDVHGDPKGWPGALLPNYRNAIWGCVWEPVTHREWNRINAEEWGMPQGLSNGWGDDEGPAKMARKHPRLLDEVIKRFHENTAPRKRCLE